MRTIEKRLKALEEKAAIKQEKPRVTIKDFTGGPGGKFQGKIKRIRVYVNTP